MTMSASATNKVCADDSANVLSFKLNDILTSYYSSLEDTGYIPYDMVYRILVLQLIEELYSDKFGIILDEDDYRMLSRCAVKLSGSRLIPYDVYMRNTTLPKQMKHTGYRMTEVPSNSLMRFTEDANLRTY